MPPTINPHTLTFENDRTARAVFPDASDKPKNIVEALDLTDQVTTNYAVSAIGSKVVAYSV